MPSLLTPPVNISVTTRKSGLTDFWSKFTPVQMAKYYARLRLIKKVSVRVIGRAGAKTVKVAIPTFSLPSSEGHVEFVTITWGNYLE